MLSISSSQLKSLDEAHQSVFYRELEEHLTAEFPEVDPGSRSQLMAACRKACDTLGIKYMNGISAFHTLSFMHGSTINQTEEYQAAHRRYILLGYEPGQLPIDTLDEMHRCGH